MSGFLIKLKEELSAEIVDNVLDHAALQGVMNGEGDLEPGVKDRVGRSYEDLKEFMT
ncbi:unnamed protein product [Choristocarpus tenellus]